LNIKFELKLNQSSILASRSDIRKQSQQNVYLFTKELLKRTVEIAHIAEEIAENDKSDEFCQTSAKRVLRHDTVHHNLFNLYQKETQKCWDFINDIQVSLMCSACDPRAQKYLNFETGELKINEDTF